MNHDNFSLLKKLKNTESAQLCWKKEAIHNLELRPLFSVDHPVVHFKALERRVPLKLQVPTAREKKCPKRKLKISPKFFWRQLPYLLCPTYLCFGIVTLKVPLPPVFHMCQDRLKSCNNWLDINTVCCVVSGWSFERKFAVGVSTFSHSVKFIK